MVSNVTEIFKRDNKQLRMLKILVPELWEGKESCQMANSGGNLHMWVKLGILSIIIKRIVIGRMRKGLFGGTSN